MFQRRDLLKLSVAGMVAARLGPAAAQDRPVKPSEAPSPPPAAAEPATSTIPLGPSSPFGPTSVSDLARALAKQPYRAPNLDLPEPFKTLSYEQYSHIRLHPDALLWMSDSLGFVIEPMQRGFENNAPIVLHVVEDGKAFPLIYSTKLFDFAGLKPNPAIGDIGFGGFKVLVPEAAKDDGKAPGATASSASMTQIASFMGTNFFQALAVGQVPGLMARALALKVADPKGEEIPYFRQIWIEKPSVVAGVLVVHALVDSDSLTGAFRFTIRPGGATIIDTEATLFARRDIDNIGFAAMSSTHLLGFMDHKRFDDYRPNVDEIDGLQMLTGNSEWVWRPVTNRATLQVSSFIDNKPRGFGSLIRDRDFQDYLDEDAQWQRRPSLWIEPIGEWAEGGVQLIEIPSTSDANDNILCFWRPKAVIKGGSEMSYAYRQFWCWDPPEKPDVARATRSHAGSTGKRKRFFVEFAGDILGDGDKAKDATAALTASAGSITMVRTFPDPMRKTLDVLFELDPGNAELSELRLVLEARGQRLSETWLYRWTPL